MSNFSGGLGDLSIDRRFLGDSEAYLAINCDISSKIGALRAVRDNKLVSDTLSDPIHAFIKFNESFLVHSGDNLYYSNLNTVSRANFSGTSPASFLKYEGNTYLANGIEYLRFNGSSYDIPFVSAPSSAGLAADGGEGKLDAGTYDYRITKVRNFNTAIPSSSRDESPPSSTFSVTIAADRQIDITGIPEESGFSHALYRRKQNSGELEFRKVTEILEGTTTFTDNLLRVDLSDILITELYETPPIPKILNRFNQNAMLMQVGDWQDQPQKILDNYAFWSANRRFSNYNPTFLSVIGETDDVLLNGHPLNNDFYFYTKTLIKRLRGTQALDYLETDTVVDTGLAATNVLAKTVSFGDLLLGSDRKIHLFNGFELIDPPDMRKMDDIFSKFSNYPYAMNWKSRDEARLVYHDRIARLAYPSGNNTQNDKVLNIDFRDYQRTGRLKFTISDYQVKSFYSDKINNILFLGDYNGNIKEVEGADTFLSPIWQGKDWDGEDIHADKTYRKIWVDMDSQGKEVEVALFIDDIASGTITLNKDSREKLFDNFLSFNNDSSKGKRASLKFSWDNPDTQINIYDAQLDIPKARKS